jgi:hypothetical protein
MDNAEEQMTPYDDQNAGKMMMLTMAFGQGTGSLLLREEDAVAAAGKLSEAVSRTFERWELTSAAVVLLVRQAGQMAAHRALSDRRLEVTMNDVDNVLDRIQTAYCRCP